MFHAFSVRSYSLVVAAVLLAACASCTGQEKGAATDTAVAPGDVDLKKLPVPTGAQPVYVGADVAMYVADAPVDATVEACRKLLLDQGWQPYGKAGDAQFYKQNLIRLTANVAAAPAQGGKTMISYSREKMSADLPAPPDAISIHYADSTKQLHCDTKASQADVAAFYRMTLSKSGWEATTEQPIQIDFKKMQIFRNAAKDLMELETHEVDGVTRFTLEFQTAAEAAAMEERMKAEIARKKAEADKPLPKFGVEVPFTAKDLELSKSRIEFKLTSGEARAAVEAWRKAFTAAGWKESVTTFEPAVGAVDFSRDGKRLSVLYTDPGFIPAEISLQATGVELERK